LYTKSEKIFGNKIILTNNFAKKYNIYREIMFEKTIHANHIQPTTVKI